MKRLLTGTLLTSLALLSAATASVATFETGITRSNVFTTGSSDQRNLWFDRTAQAGAGVLRIDVVWRSIAPAVRPANPASPFAYDFSGFDDSILRAQQRGLEVMLTVFVAPSWAEAPGRSASAAVGTWKPDPQEFALFGRALATHFNGVLGPRVKYFEAWNEPNLGTFLTPQWANGTKIVSADHYRRMLNAFYAAVKGVHSDNVVLSAGTAPYGDDVGTGASPTTGGRTRPLQFYRELMCLKRTRNKKTNCPTKAKLDIAAHHPINRSGSPRSSAAHPDDVTTPDLGKNFVSAVRFAEKKGTILPKRKGREIWATEIWIETNPPDKEDGVSLSKAGDWLAERSTTGSKVPIRSLTTGSKMTPTCLVGLGTKHSVSTGLWFHPAVQGGRQKKPVYTAFRFPFVTDRESREKLIAWGKAPRGRHAQDRAQIRQGLGDCQEASRQEGPRVRDEPQARRKA